MDKTTHRLAVPVFGAAPKVFIACPGCSHAAVTLRESVADLESRARMLRDLGGPIKKSSVSSPLRLVPR